MLIPDVVAGQVGQRMAAGLTDGRADADGVEGAQLFAPVHDVGAVVAGLDLDDVQGQQHAAPMQEFLCRRGAAVDHAKREDATGLPSKRHKTSPAAPAWPTHDIC